MKKRVSHVVPLHREPRSARLPPVVLVLHVCLRRQGMHSQAEEEYSSVQCQGETKQSNSATRKPRDAILLRATRDSSCSKVEQHKTHSSVRTCVDRPLRNCAFVFRQGKR